MLVVSVCPFFSPSDSVFFTLYHLPFLPTQSRLDARWLNLVVSLLERSVKHSRVFLGRPRAIGSQGPLMEAYVTVVLLEDVEG